MKFRTIATSVLLIAASPWLTHRADAKPLREGLSDPDAQSIFKEIVSNALDPGYIFDTSEPTVVIGAGENRYHSAGLVDEYGEELYTPIWGYGVDGEYLWPGKTIEAKKDVPINVTWVNELPIGTGHILTSLDGESVVDTSLHWAFMLEGYTQYNLVDDGIPMVVHIHGGHSEYQSDGDPEFFFTPDFAITGPQYLKEQSTTTPTTNQLGLSGTMTTRLESHGSM